MEVGMKRKRKRNHRGSDEEQVMQKLKGVDNESDRNDNSSNKGSIIHSPSVNNKCHPPDHKD